jgi:serine/threonine-protein kinase RsbW
MALSEQMPGNTGPDTGDEPTTPGDHPPLAVGDVIELTVPALSTYLGVVRTATAGLAARLSFTFDEIEDLRIAVDEACVMVLSLPASKTTGDQVMLTCTFRVLPDALAVSVSAPVHATAVLPGEQSFAWQVLTAHASAVSGSIDGGHASVGLRKPRKV